MGEARDSLDWNDILVYCDVYNTNWPLTDLPENAGLTKTFAVKAFGNSSRIRRHGECQARYGRLTLSVVKMAGPAPCNQLRPPKRKISEPTRVHSSTVRCATGFVIEEPGTGADEYQMVYTETIPAPASFLK